MQSSSLSTYIGYITGPRAEQPVGVRVVEPTPGSRQHQRGSLYIVAEVVGDHPDRGAIVDRLLSEVQRVYYSAKGSQSQVMVEAVQQTQQLLREINAHTPHYPMQLGITCAALLGGKLLVASSGPAFALMRVSDRVHMFPSEPNMTVPNLSVGGYGSVPIEVYRQDVQVDDAIFLGGGGWLRRVPTRTLASIVAFTNADNCADAADELYDQAGQMQVPGLLIVLGVGANNEPPRPSGYGGGGYGGGRYPSSPGGATPGGGAPRASAPRRPRFGGLPTSVNTTPPARMPASQVPPSTSLTGAHPPATASPASPAPSGHGRSSLAEREQPPPAVSPTVSQPIVETPNHQSQSSASSQQYDAAIHEPAVPDSAPVEQARPEPPPVTASTELTSLDQAAEPSLDLPSDEVGSTSPTQPYPVSPLEARSFGGDLPVEPGDEFDPIFPPSTTQEPVEETPRRVSWLEQWQAGAGARMAQARGFLGRMLPDRKRPGEATEWQEISDELIVPPRPARPRFNEMAAAQAGISERAAGQQAQEFDDAVDDADDDAGEPMHVDMPALEMSPFTPPAPTRGARARLFLLVALVIAILVPVVVLAVNLGQGNSNRVEAEKLTARAEIVLLGAQSMLDQGDKVTARERLTEAQDYLRQAIELDGTNEHRGQLIATIESELQEVLQIMPLYALTVPLITFPPAKGLGDE